MSALIHDPITRFIAQVAVIIFASRLLGIVARRVGQPMVIAEVTAGILLGPSLLGWLAPDTYQALFAPDSLKVLNLVSQLGLVLFMFLVGLELDPALLRGRGHTSVVISHTSIIAPFVMGVAFAFYLRPRLSDPSVKFLPFALFVGAAMSITAFPVLARILTERRLLRTRVGAVTIACAAVDDVTAWCILAFVVATARATGIGAAIRTTGLAVGYIFFMVWVVRPLLSRVAARVGDPEGLTQNVVAVTIMMLLASAWATELIGIHALFGAFLFGAVLPKQGGLAGALVEKIEDLVVVVILPLFFAYSGVRTQIGLLDSWWAWGMCGLIIAIACLGKFGASAVAARLTGLGWREAGALGILMNTRGLMELIVLNIGLDLGVINPTLFTMMVIMALVTTLATTPLLELIYPMEKLTADLVAEVEPGPAPVANGVPTTLVCVAHPGSGPGLLTVARALQPPAGEHKTIALHLTPASERGSFYRDRSERGTTPSALSPLLERAEDLGVKVSPISFVSADAAADICGMAAVKKATLILLGAHKPILTQTRLGGIAQEVIREARGDVGILFDRGLHELKRVLLPFRSAPHDRAALALAKRSLQNLGTEITILHVVKPERKLDEAKGAREEANKVFDEGELGRVVFKVVEDRDPADAAVKEAANGYDLLMVGFDEEWGVHDRAFGILPEPLMQDCPTSVLVIRHGEA